MPELTDNLLPFNLLIQLSLELGEGYRHCVCRIENLWVKHQSLPHGPLHPCARCEVQDRVTAEHWAIRIQNPRARRGPYEDVPKLRLTIPWAREHPRGVVLVGEENLFVPWAPDPENRPFPDTVEPRDRGHAQNQRMMARREVNLAIL